MTTKRSQHQDPSPDPVETIRVVTETEWGPTEVVFRIRTTEPGTLLDDHLMAKQTQVLLELLSDTRKRGDLPGR